MIAIPAIDLKSGNVVRLLQGRYEEVKVYSHDPAETAKLWQKEGVERLHVVDLDGALAGEVKNMEALRQIITNTTIPVQFGGGLRTREDIKAILDAGASWAILGTKACEDMEFTKQIIDEFGEKIMVSIDVKFKMVAARGWSQTTGKQDTALINELKAIGVPAFIYTDISRDGTLAGPNVKEITRVLQETGASIFYSGGISSMEDIRALKLLEKDGLAGIIIGKALYEDKIHLTQVKAALEQPGEPA